MLSVPLLRRATTPVAAGIALLLALRPAPAAEPLTHTPLEAVPTTETLRIDGILDEPAWEGALVIDNFLQQIPLEAAPPSERTVVRILYDDVSLYIGIRCYDADPSRIRIGSLLRDSFSQNAGETIAFAIDSSNSGRDGYWFSSNPGGAQLDSQVVNEGEVFRSEWDAIWESAGIIDGEGWAVEIRLPFYNLQFRRGPTNVMRINFFRNLHHKNEEDYAPYIPRNYPRGTMSFSIGQPIVFHDIRPGRTVQVKPYGLVSAAGELEGTWDTDVTGDAGIDVKWTVTPNYTADFTVNPDFAQADADEVQINLTRFPLFFPEKREFFLENAGLFSFGVERNVQAFFSRRIGLDPDGEPVPLLGGARLTGRSGPWSVGALDVVSDDTAREPRTNFFVGRVKRDILKRSSVGVIVTDRQERHGGGSRLGGTDALFRFHEDHTVEGFVMASQNSGQEEQWAANAEYSKSGDRWRWEVEGRLVDEGFDPGIGFVRRPGIQVADGSLAFRPRPAKLRAVRQFEFSGGLSYLEARVEDPSLNGTVLDRDWHLLQRTEFETGDRLAAFYVQRFERLTEGFEIFEGVAIPPGDYDNDEVEVNFNTFNGRRVSAFGFVNHGAFFDGRRTIWGAGVTARFSRHLSLDSRYFHNRVRLPFGDFDTNLWINRLDYAFTATLFGSVLVQWNDVTDDIDVNLRLRWRHHPGSDLFVVYNESRNTDRAPGERNSNFRQGIVKLTWAVFF